MRLPATGVLAVHGLRPTLVARQSPGVSRATRRPARAAAAGGCIDEAVLLDRGLDCVTPMCTQLTYEGLVDETLRIRNGAVSLDGPAGAAPHPGAAAAVQRAAAAARRRAAPFLAWRMGIHKEFHGLYTKNLRIIADESMRARAQAASSASR